MSLLEKLFGAGKDKGKTPSPQEAIQRLREIEEMLNKKNDFLEKKIAEELQYAKKHGTKNKRSMYRIFTASFRLVDWGNLFAYTS